MKTHLTPIAHTGLRAGAPQILGAVRLVPLLREHAPGDLRIASRSFGDSYGVVRLDGRPGGAGRAYASYVPHGLVVSHTNDGSVAAALGTSLGPGPARSVRLHHRMVKREDAGGGGRFRMLPLHLAMEGYLALHVSGPDILWRGYSEAAASRGLLPRVERSVRGACIEGLAEALRVFEIAERQVGVMVFVAGALASVFVVSHPDDYRALHRSLLEDFFGEILRTYAYFHANVALSSAPFRVDGAASLEALEEAVARYRGELEEEAALLAAGLFERPVVTERVRALAPFVLERFLPVFDPAAECHIGERIVRADGALEYMKTFRLSQAQIRRGHLLSKLAEAEWCLDRAAERLVCSRKELEVRLVNAGFGHLLAQEAPAVREPGRSARRPHG